MQDADGGFVKRLPFGGAWELPDVDEEVPLSSIRPPAFKHENATDVDELLARATAKLKPLSDAEEAVEKAVAAATAPTHAFLETEDEGKREIQEQRTSMKQRLPIFNR